MKKLLLVGALLFCFLPVKADPESLRPPMEVDPGFLAGDDFHPIRLEVPPMTADGPTCPVSQTEYRIQELERKVAGMQKQITKLISRVNAQESRCPCQPRK